MSREILCRAKRIDGGGWIEGGLVRYGWTGQEKYYVVPSFASALYAIEVDPATVGQDTGLTDRNGKKVFEDDIVTGTFYHMFDETDVMFSICWQADVGGWGFNNYDITQLEVIGNIYDNPELLS